ncbi:MAG: hypothetical protein AAGK37_20400 [Pseudomonadota bacterium]
MSFIRPEVAEQLNRWRETLAGTAAFAFGAFWMITEPGAMRIIGTALTVGGALLLVAGIQRARFRKGSDGAGVVQVIEGQVTYFGPTDGGVLASDQLVRVELIPNGAKAPSWRITHRTGEPLTIPIDARGAEALFDVFAALPGLDTAAMLEEMNRIPAFPVTIWQQGTPRLH